MLSIASTGSLSASELVSFANGFHLEADSHRRVGHSVVLEQAGGTIEVDADQVVSIETLSDPTDRQGENDGAHLLPAITSARDPIQLLSQASAAEGLPANFVLSVAHVESGFQVGARSPKGAIGLMQLMPQTAAALGVVADRTEDNAAGGARYLRELLIRYKGDSRLALAAYNAGSIAVDRFRDVPPYPETQRYVERVLREYARREATSRAGTATATTKQSMAKRAESGAPRYLNSAVSRSIAAR